MDCLHGRFYGLEPRYPHFPGLGGRHKELLHRMTTMKWDGERQGNLLTQFLNRILLRPLRGVVNIAVLDSGGCVGADK